MSCRRLLSACCRRLRSRTRRCCSLPLRCCSSLSRFLVARSSRILSSLAARSASLASFWACRVVAFSCLARSRSFRRASWSICRSSWGNILFGFFFFFDWLRSSSSRAAHQSKDIRGGGEKGDCILFICLDVPDLSTIGTLAGCSGGNLIGCVRARGSNVSGIAGFMMQFLLLFSSLSSCLILLQSFELLLNSTQLLVAYSNSSNTD